MTHSRVAAAGGMFLWVTIRIETHPQYRPEKKRELMDALWEHLAENKCLGTCSFADHLPSACLPGLV